MVCGMLTSSSITPRKWICARVPSMRQVSCPRVLSPRSSLSLLYISGAVPLLECKEDKEYCLVTSRQSRTNVTTTQSCASQKPDNAIYAGAHKCVESTSRRDKSSTRHLLEEATYVQRADHHRSGRQGFPPARDQNVKCLVSKVSLNKLYL